MIDTRGVKEPPLGRGKIAARLGSETETDARGGGKRVEYGNTLEHGR